MEEKHETDALFHNWLAEIYLDLTLDARAEGDKGKLAKRIV